MPSPSESIAASESSAFEWMLNFRLMPNAPDEDEDASEDDVDCARANTAQHDSAKNATTIATRKTRRRGVTDDVIDIQWWW